MVANSAKTYPVMPAKQWFRLREEFRRSLPGTIEPNYLASKLDIAIPTARNVLSGLRSMGLVDDQGRTNRDLIVRWRDDATYAEACGEIIQRVYPDVIDKFPPPDVNRPQLASWMGKETGAGTSAAGQMAALYEIIARADPTMGTAKKEGQRQGNRAGNKTTPRARRGSTSIAPSSNGGTPAAGQVPVVPTPTLSLPTLNVNIQVHIAADTPEDRTRSLIKDMAKYFFGREVDE